MTALPATNIGQAIKAAASKLALAATAGEVLEARDMASLAYDAAKRAARLQKAKRAHDDIIAATHRAQADALEIEALAKRKLADEYDAAQERGEVQKAGGNRKIKVPDGNNDPATSAELGISRKDVHEARQVRDAIAKNPAIVRDVLDDMLASGDEPTRAALKRAIAPVVKTLRSEAQAEKKERRAVREIELGAKQAALPAKKYGVIYADPEWRFDPYSTETGMDRSPDNHYPTSSLLTLMQRDVGALAAKDCVLFLWTTAPMLVEAICLLDAWGFAWIERDPSTGFLAPNKAHARYVSNWTWLKNRIATGYWNRGKHEILLIATRGNPVAPAMGDQLDSWLFDERLGDMAIEADVGRHSAKPTVFAEWIEKHWPSTPKIELNARAPRPGWDVWGNESQAKASEDNGGTSATDGAPMAGEASRPDAGRSASATSEITDATAGETAPNLLAAARAFRAKAVPA